MRAAPCVVLICATVSAACDVTAPDRPRPSELTVLSINDRSVGVGERMLLVVRLTDGREPVAGVTVSFEIASGLGTVEPIGRDDGSVVVGGAAAVGVTARDGRASAELITGPGENRVVARVRGTDLSAVLTAHGCMDCGEWSVISLVPRADIRMRAWAGAAAVNGRIWVVGGEAWPDSGAFDDVLVFDPTATMWSRAARLPLARTATVVLPVGDKVYVLGGSPDWCYGPGQSSVVAIDPRTGELTDRAPLASGRFFAAAAVLAGRIFVAGGLLRCDPDWCGPGPLASVEIYDPATNLWTPGPDLNVPRSGAGAAVLDGKLYIAGGSGGDLHPFDGPIGTVEMYDPMTRRWTLRAPLPIVGPVHLATLNGKLLAFEHARFFGYSRVFEYDPVLDAWTRLRDAPGKLIGAAVATVDGLLYAVGGYSEATDNPFVRRISHAVYAMRR